MYNFEYDYALINHGTTIIDNKNNIIYNFAIKNDLELNKTYKYFCCSRLERS